MAKQQTLSTGIKINVDTTDLDIKFAKAAADLNKSLTKSQKALGLFYNEQGLLVNSQGQVVEGLSQAQVKLGQYVDELGRTRTYQGGFTEGLNASQKAMGWFSDELGNVYNRLGELVIESKRAADGLDEIGENTRDLDEAFEKMESAAGSALGSLGSLGGQTAQLFATIQAATGETDAFTSSIIAASEGLSVFIDTYGGIVGVMQYMDALRRATEAQSVATSAAAIAQKGLNAAIKANPVGLIVGGVAALTAAVATYKSTVKEAASGSVGAFAEIEEAARRAGESIKSAADIARFGFRAPDTYKSLSSEYDNLAKERDDLQKSISEAPKWYENPAFAQDESNISYDPETSEAYRREREQAKQAKERLDVINKRMETIQERLVGLQEQVYRRAHDSVLLESQKLEAQREELKALAENIDNLEKRDVLERRILQLTEQIEDAKKKELDSRHPKITEADYSLDAGALADAVAAGRYTVEEAQAAYQGALERQTKVLESIGISGLMEELQTIKTPMQQLDDMATKLNAAYSNGVVVQDKYNESFAAIAAKRADLQKTLDDEAKEAADAAKAELRSKYGVDDALSAMEAEIQAQKTPFELMNEVIAGYWTVVEQGGLDIATFNKLANREREKYLKAMKDATDAAEQERRSKIESLRGESGIESLLDSLKTPWQKYLENLNKINGYVAEGAVTAAEAQLLADKALNDAATDNDAWTRQLDAAKRRAEAQTKTVDTATAGSADLYRMQVAQANDQAAKMLEAQRQLLASSQQMALYLYRVQENIAAMAANWPKVYGR